MSMRSICKKMFPMSMLASSMAVAAEMPQMPQIEISGLAEVEASATEDFDGNNSTDITLATVELGFDAAIAENVDAHILVLYEEDETDPPEIDEGTLSLGFANNLSVTAGKLYVPFGNFDSNMVSDPLTLEVAETNETVVQAGYERGDFYGSVWAANGDSNEIGSNDDDKMLFGANIGFVMGETLSAGITYINNIADTDSLQDLGADGDVDDFVAGVDLFVTANFGPVQLIGEYVTALDELRAGDLGGAVVADSEPSAYHVEAAYSFSNGLVLAATWQETDEALFMGLPASYAAVSVGYEIMKNTALTFEYGIADDYDEDDGGSGDDASQAVLQLAAWF